MQNEGEIVQEEDGQGYYNSGKKNMGKNRRNNERHDVIIKCIGNHEYTRKMFVNPLGIGQNIDE
jgi:hypothetical protein